MQYNYNKKSKGDISMRLYKLMSLLFLLPSLALAQMAGICQADRVTDLKITNQRGGDLTVVLSDPSGATPQDALLHFNKNFPATQEFLNVLILRKHGNNYGSDNYLDVFDNATGQKLCHINLPTESIKDPSKQGLEILNVKIGKDSCSWDANLIACTANH